MLGNNVIYVKILQQSVIPIQTSNVEVYIKLSKVIKLLAIHANNKRNVRIKNSS
jgi:hypothetical protein